MRAPQKTTGKIEHIKTRKSIDCSDTPEAHIEKHRMFVEIWDKINELIDAVNKHADIIQQIGEWGTNKGECLWCETLTKFEPEQKD